MIRSACWRSREYLSAMLWERVHEHDKCHALVTKHYNTTNRETDKGLNVDKSRKYGLKSRQQLLYSVPLIMPAILCHIEVKVKKIPALI